MYAPFGDVVNHPTGMVVWYHRREVTRLWMNPHPYLPMPCSEPGEDVVRLTNIEALACGGSHCRSSVDGLV
jgi:hypothetical protein